MVMYDYMVIHAYPHHAVLAFVNTPFGTEPKNPAECMPRNVRDTRMGFYAFRNRWQDGDDIVITQLVRRSPARFRHGPDKALTIQHHGRRESWGTIPARASHWASADDGSAVVGDGESFLAIDFSGASGAPGMLVMTGSAATGDAVLTAGGRTYSFKFLLPEGGAVPQPMAVGEQVVVGEQIVGVRGGALFLGTFAGTR